MLKCVPAFGPILVPAKEASMVNALQSPSERHVTTWHTPINGEKKGGGGGGLVHLDTATPSTKPHKHKHKHTHKHKLEHKHEHKQKQ